MDFRVLGNVEVYADQRRLEVGPPRNRTVLALLLAHAGSVLSVTYLVDELWPDRAPEDARLLAQGYVSRLRRSLRAGPGGDRAADRLVTRRPGYVLLVEGPELDLFRFESRVAEARRAAREGDWARALEKFRQAQREWRSTPFDDAPPTQALDVEATRLSELRLRVLEEQFDIELSIGNEATIIPELTKYVAEYPLHGHLVRQLMVALHRCARTADALKTYARAKTQLSEDLGLDPPRELSDLQLAILRDDPALRTVPPAPVGLAEPPNEVGRSQQARPASTSEAPVSRKPRYHVPAYNLRRQYLTAFPEPTVHEPVGAERRIWLAGGPYGVRQFMGDAEDVLVEDFHLQAGHYRWQDRLTPSVENQYVHETALAPDTADRKAPERLAWSSRWSLSESGIYTWGSILDPEF